MRQVSGYYLIWTTVRLSTQAKKIIQMRLADPNNYEIEAFDFFSLRQAVSDTSVPFIFQYSSEHQVTSKMSRVGEIIKELVRKECLKDVERVFHKNATSIGLKVISYYYLVTSRVLRREIKYMDKVKIRKAVGAIVFQDNEYLLVHKVKSINTKTDIPGHWDFPKGGIQDSDEDLEVAVLRELKEETGSSQYSIIREYNKKINFIFPKGHKYDCQETHMFLVEYLGNKTDLKPQDEEISDVRFYNKDEVIRIIDLKETSVFLKEVVW